MDNDRHYICYKTVSTDILFFFLAIIGTARIVKDVAMEDLR